MTVPLRLLAVAVRQRSVGGVFLNGGQLVDWRISDRAGQSPIEAAGVVQEWINGFEPMAVVTEALHPQCRKGERSKRLIASVAHITSHNPVLDIAVPRVQNHANKYEEAASLADRHPELLAWVPKRRRCFDKEPRNTVIFEALALAHEVIDAPPSEFAATME